jgi:hypothetical protein
MSTEEYIASLEGENDRLKAELSEVLREVQSALDDSSFEGMDPSQTRRAVRAVISQRNDAQRAGHRLVEQRDEALARANALEEEVAGLASMAVQTRDFNARQIERLQRMILDAIGAGPDDEWPGNALAAQALSHIDEGPRIAKIKEHLESEGGTLSKRMGSVRTFLGVDDPLILELHAALASRNVVQTGFGRKPFDDEVLDMIENILRKASR